MKKTGLFVFIGLFLMTVSLSAQRGAGQNQRKDKPAPRQEMKKAPLRGERCLALDLELTEEQRAKVIEHHEKQQALRDAKIAEFQKEGDTNRETWQENRQKFREEMDKLRAEGDVELEKIIGKEKMTQLNKMREENRQKFRDSKRPRRDGSRAPQRSTPPQQPVEK